MDHLSSQAVCLRGEWSRGGGRGWGCYRNPIRISSLTSVLMGKTEHPGLPLVNAFWRSDGLLCQDVVFGFVPKGWFNEEEFSREKGNAHTKGNAFAAGGAVSAAGMQDWVVLRSVSTFQVNWTGPGRWICQKSLTSWVVGTFEVPPTRWPPDLRSFSLLFIERFSLKLALFLYIYDIYPPSPPFPLVGTPSQLWFHVLRSTFPCRSSALPVLPDKNLSICPWSQTSSFPYQQIRCNCRNMLLIKSDSSVITVNNN